MMTAEQAAEYGWGTSGDDVIVSPAAGPDTNWATESRGNDRVYYPSELEDTIWEVESRGDDQVVEPETAEIDEMWPLPDGLSEYAEEYQFYL
jgi:hypothetical protein